MHLIYGVIGSGKTEIYIHLIHQIIKEKGNVIFLVSEFSFIEKIENILVERLENINLIIWHGYLSEKEKHKRWLSIINSKSVIIIGLKSAIFLPLKDLRLIIVDDEHNVCFKNNKNPRYHARDISIYRSKLCNAVCILGSATPSLESINNVFNKKFKLNILKESFNNRFLPIFDVIDMKEEILNANYQILISQTLSEKIKVCYSKRQQIILFYNKEGYSKKTICLICGFLFKCSFCNIPFIYYKNEKQFKCNICQYILKTNLRCIKCNSEKLKFYDLGNQRLEEIINSIIPKAIVIQCNENSISSKLLLDFNKGIIDILISTYPLYKDLYFSNVTLLGIINFDNLLNVLNFRSSERTFQTIVQIFSRFKGEVIIQTSIPDNKILQYAVRENFRTFIKNEMQMRSEYGYPPFRKMIRHIFKSKDEARLVYFTEQWVTFLKENMHHKIDIRGPLPANIKKIKNYYRYHICILTENLLFTINKLLILRKRFVFNNIISDTFDVDPINFH